mmetsp:Transcript_60706/g.169711  ORF Transcript_60706/g.169711 Transcript_60706/m.169711 type:complete len:214 (-) Transcript_60706:95-736(-)
MRVVSLAVVPDEILTFRGIGLWLRGRLQPRREHPWDASVWEREPLRRWKLSGNVHWPRKGNLPRHDLELLGSLWYLIENLSCGFGMPSGGVELVVAGLELAEAPELLDRVEGRNDSRGQGGNVDRWFARCRNALQDRSLRQRKSCLQDRGLVPQLANQLLHLRKRKLELDLYIFVAVALSYLIAGRRCLRCCWNSDRGGAGHAAASERGPAHA